MTGVARCFYCTPRERKVLILKQWRPLAANKKIVSNLRELDTLKRNSNIKMIKFYTILVEQSCSLESLTLSVERKLNEGVALPL